MASLTIRDLDDDTKERLRVRAAKRRRSMEEEARQILREAVRGDAVGEQTGADLFAAIRRRFEPLGGFDLELPPRDEPIRDPPSFGSTARKPRRKARP